MLVKRSQRLDQAEQIIDYQGAWIMPGLVNCHTHSAMTAWEGFEMIAISMNGSKTIFGQQKLSLLPTWLPRRSKKLWQRCSSQEQQHLTICISNGVDIEQIYQAVKDSKMHCYFSPTLFSSEAETTAETIARTRAIIEEILGYENPNFKVMVAPTFSLQL